GRIQRDGHDQRGHVRQSLARVPLDGSTADTLPETDLDHQRISSPVLGDLDVDVRPLVLDRPWSIDERTLDPLRDVGLGRTPSGRTPAQLDALVLVVWTGGWG